jgi:hypothetical protein
LLLLQVGASSLVVLASLGRSCYRLGLDWRQRADEGRSDGSRKGDGKLQLTEMAYSGWGRRRDGLPYQLPVRWPVLIALTAC